jgi:hypothetical protein
MSRTSQLQVRLAKLRPLVSGAVDCLHEAENNVARGEWRFATVNLRKLFRNATAIQRQRAAVLHELHLARKESEP